MRWVIAFFLAGIFASALCRADDKVVQIFDGTAAQTTPAFQVQDKWQVQWNCASVIDVTVVAADGSVVVEANSPQNTLTLPKSGSYSLRITRPDVGSQVPWHISVTEPSVAAVAAAPAVPTPAAATNAAPAPGLMPTFNAATPSNLGTLTEQQAHAVVVIKGDVAEGTGFLVHGPDGPTVITNLHVLAANPNVKILTTTGEQIRTTGLKGASDRDLAMISILDSHYTYLDLATDIPGTVLNGDEVITPGNSEGGEVVLDTKGKVLGIGPEKIEVSNPIYHGNSGGPVFHSKSGKVIAVVSQGQKVHMQDDLDKASFGNKDSAITASMRYFGLRIDTVPKWETYDWAAYLNETNFLSRFHDLSRCLDSFMNGAQYEKQHIAGADENSPPNAMYYMKSPRLVEAHDNYHHMINDADQSQRLDAAREMAMDLQGIGGTDMDAVQNASNFYGFDELRAKQEIKYRQALLKEIQSFGDKVSDMGH